jgi:hypothetical protein
MSARAASRRYATLALILAAGSLFLLGAKCIENDSLRRGEDGDWHIYGEIHNETQAQGAEIVVVGTLLDANGNAIATAQAPICPFELTPGTFSGYDIHFHDSENIPQPASYKINVLSGKVLPGPLPHLEVTVTDLDAERVGDQVFIRGDLRANQPIEGDFKGCAGFYDAAGKMIQHVSIFGFGPLPSGNTQPLELPLPLVPDAAETVRFWLVGPGDLLSSNWRPIISDHIPIQ